MQLAAAVAEHVVQKLRHLRSQPVLAPEHTGTEVSSSTPSSQLSGLPPDEVASGLWGLLQLLAMVYQLVTGREVAALDSDHFELDMFMAGLHWVVTTFSRRACSSRAQMCAAAAAILCIAIAVLISSQRTRHQAAPKPAEEPRQAVTDS